MSLQSLREQFALWRVDRKQKHRSITRTTTRHSRKSRIETLEDRWVLAGNIFAHVFDPVVAPSEEVLVTWRIEHEFFDHLDLTINGGDGDGQLDQEEANRLQILIDVFFNGFKNAIEVTPRLDGNFALDSFSDTYRPNAYVTADGDLRGFTRLPLTAAMLPPTTHVFVNAASSVAGGGISTSTPIYMSGDASVLSDPVAEYLSRHSTTDGISSSTWLEDMAFSIMRFNPDMSLAEDFLIARIAENALQIEEAIAIQANDNPSSLSTTLPFVLSDAFGGNAILHQWDPKVPTLVVVHGIRTAEASQYAYGEELQRAMPEVNVLTYAWGFTSVFNGLDRTLSDVLFSANHFSPGGLPALQRLDAQANLAGMVELNAVLQLLRDSYASAGKLPEQMVNIVAHSEGTVVTTGALLLGRTSGNPSQRPKLNQVFYIGANLDRKATMPNHELHLVPWNELGNAHLTNYHSEHDYVVTMFSGEGAGGKKGFLVDPTATYLEQVRVESIPFASAYSDLRVEHTGTLGYKKNEFGLGDFAWRIGWLDWFLWNSKLFSGIMGAQRDGVVGSDAATTVTTAVKHGSVPAKFDFKFGSQILAALDDQFDLAYGPYLVAGQTFTAPVFVDVLSFPTLGGATASPNPAIQGETVAVTTINPGDLDNDLARADVYIDLNGNSVPDSNEYLASNYFRAGRPLRVPFSTKDFAIGNYVLLVQLVDSRNQHSNVVSTTLEVVAPGTAPPALPESIDPALDPDYDIIPHRNGDVRYSSAQYSLGSGDIDLWQITPQNAGNFSFTTTGNTDVVLGLYDGINGQRLAFDENNGPGQNAELVASLQSDHTYFLAVVTEQGDSGGYGLDVTGINQTITATPAFSAPLYEASAIEAIDQAFELDYFHVDVPATTTTLNVVLDVAGGLNGWVRVENSAYETLATAFLAGQGEGDVLRGVPVIPGDDVFITVAALDGTIGNYTLRLDFGPDEPGLPATLDPPPADGLRIVPLPDGTYVLPDESIATPGEFRSYQFPTRDSAGGEYTFETFGSLDTQIGVYLRHSASNSTLIASDDDSGGGENARLTVTLNGGDDYIIIVRGEGNDTGDFDLSVAGPSVAASNLTISGLAYELTTNYVGFGTDLRFVHYQIVAPETATLLNLQTENEASWPNLDVSLRVSDANGNVLVTADVTGPGLMEQIENLNIVGGESYYITLYTEDHTVGSARIHLDFDPDFVVGSGAEFPVNTTFDGFQDFPDVARNSNGQAVVVWSDRFHQDVRAQRFDASGQPVGGEFTIADAFGAIVGMADNGNFVVVYDASKYRVFNFNGSPLTAELDIGFSAVGGIDIAVEPNGKFFIAGTTGGGTASRQLIGRLFAANGTPLTPPTVLDDTEDGNQDPSVAVDGNGNFIITWRADFDAPGSANDRNQVYAIRVDSSGNVLPSGRNSYVHGVVTGRRFDDLNANGRQDPGEAGFQGVTVLLDADGDGIQDAGEQTQVTDVVGNYTFSGVPTGIYDVVALGGPPSGPVSMVDGFNRPDNSDLGAEWTELVGDLRIEAGRLRTQGSFVPSDAIYEPFEGIDQHVVFDVDYLEAGTSRIAGVYLAYNDPTNYLRVKFSGTGSSAGFERVIFEHSGQPVNGWPRMSGGSYSVLVPQFATGRVFVGYNSASRTVTVGIDANVDGLYETVLTRGNVPTVGLGTKVGIATWNDVAIDNFTVNPNARAVPPTTAIPTEVFQVAPSLDRKQFSPYVASHGDGTFVIAFAGLLTDGTDSDIYVQRFDADAFPNGELLLANTERSADQVGPSVALLSQGKFLVAWEGDDGDGRGIRAQQVGVNMERLGPEFTLNQTIAGSQRNVVLASDGDERVISIWHGPDAQFDGVFGLDFTLDEVKEPELRVTDSSGATADRFVDFGIEVTEGGGTGSGFDPKTITVTNDGNLPLVISSIDVYGADAASFELSDDSGFALNPGQSRSIDVTFVGTDLGEHYAAIRIYHNDSADDLSGDFDANPFWVSLLARIERPVAGDYNGNGTVDAADYVLWRKTQGSNVRPYSGSDGSGDGTVGQEDHAEWRANFGETLSTGSGATATTSESNQVVPADQNQGEGALTVTRTELNVGLSDSVSSALSPLQFMPAFDAIPDRQIVRNLYAQNLRNTEFQRVVRQSEVLAAWLNSFGNYARQIPEDNDDYLGLRSTRDRSNPSFDLVDEAFDDIGEKSSSASVTMAVRTIHPIPRARLHR